MISKKMRQIMVKNMQDSLRMIRHIMNLTIKDFAAETGMTPKIINDLETKKIKMSDTQYIAIAALTDIYLENHKNILPQIKKIIDSDGKNYAKDYDTSFREDSLLKRWFENFTAVKKNLFSGAEKYKIFIDAKVFKIDCERKFVENLKAVGQKFIIPLCSVKQIEADDSALSLIKEMQNLNLVQIYGEESDPDFHDTVINVFTRFRDKYNLCLITQDKNLAQEVLKLNDSAKNNFKITAGYVEGGIFYFYDEEISVVEMTEDILKGWGEV